MYAFQISTASVIERDDIDGNPNGFALRVRNIISILSIIDTMRYLFG
jgi:hypothetical protein